MRLISSKFSLSREPASNYHSKNSKGNLQDYYRQEMNYPTQVFFHTLSNRIGDYSSKEHDKGVNYTLNKSHSDHIAIGDVGDFVREDTGQRSTMHYRSWLDQTHLIGTYVRLLMDIDRHERSWVDDSG